MVDEENDLNDMEKGPMIGRMQRAWKYGRSI